MELSSLLGPLGGGALLGAGAAALLVGGGRLAGVSGTFGGFGATDEVHSRADEGFLAQRGLDGLLNKGVECGGEGIEFLQARKRVYVEEAAAVAHGVAEDGPEAERDDFSFGAVGSDAEIVAVAGHNLAVAAHDEVGGAEAGGFGEFSFRGVRVGADGGGEGFEFDGARDREGQISFPKFSGCGDGIERGGS